MQCIVFLNSNPPEMNGIWDHCNAKFQLKPPRESGVSHAGLEL